MTDLTALEALAKAATEGPWFIHDFSEIGGAVTVSCDHPATITVATMHRAMTAELAEQQANAAYIAAAHPAAVLDLIARVRALEGALRPFADAAAEISENKPDWLNLFGFYTINTKLTVGDLRLAAAAIPAAPSKE